MTAISKVTKYYKETGVGGKSVKSQVSDNMPVINLLDLSSKVTLHCLFCGIWTGVL